MFKQRPVVERQRGDGGCGGERAGRPVRWKDPEKSIGQEGSRKAAAANFAERQQPDTIPADDKEQVNALPALAHHRN